MNQPMPEPGWYPDPGGTPQFRYWDGYGWTDHFSPVAPAPAPTLVAARPGGGLIAGVVVGVVVLALIGTAIAIALGSDHANRTATTPADARSIVEKVATIPPPVFHDVGAGGAGPVPVKLPGPVRTRNGKPLILYMGSEYCPYCATERWAIVAALSRFGTFHDVAITRSAGFPEAYPATPTFSFHGSSYDSSYITFEGVELRSNQRDPSGVGFTVRDVPTADQRAAMAQFDAPPYVDAAGTSAIPFVDFADSFLISGSTYSPEVLQGRSFDEIAGAMADPSSPVSSGAIGSANLMTAAICIVTHDRPATVCADGSIHAIERLLQAQTPR
jgi:hypothetical protein